MEVYRNRRVTLILVNAILFLALLMNVESVSAWSSDDFTIVVKTNNPGTSNDNEFTIPTTKGIYNYNVDCNDDGLNEITGVTGSYTCTYHSAGTYTIVIQDNTGEGTGFPRIYFNDGGDKDKLLDIVNWGTGHWTSMAHAFHGCSYLDASPWDDPDLSNVTDLSYMFCGASSFDTALFWDTSTVEDMSYMFKDALAFNGNITGWDVHHVTTMQNMFADARAFNRNIGGWATGNVKDMSGMFSEAYDFNQDISGWNTSNVTDMTAMFYYATTFNQPIGSWNTGNVTNMAWMFEGAHDFDQDIGDWDVTSLANAFYMFYDGHLSTINYDSLLMGWDAQVLKSGVDFNGGNSTYCIGETARQHMIDIDAWTIADDGKDCSGVYHLYLPMLSN